MGPADSSPCSQQNIYFPISWVRLIQSVPFQVEDTFHYFSPISAQVFQVVSLCLGLTSKARIPISCPPYVPHAQLIWSFFVWSHCTIWWEIQIVKTYAVLCATYCTLGPNIFLSTLITKTLSSYFHTRRQVSHQYKTTGEVISTAVFPRKSIKMSCVFTHGICPTPAIFFGLISLTIQ